MDAENLRRDDRATLVALCHSGRTRTTGIPARCVHAQEKKCRRA
jgi:hypothetical protein